jgi:tetratricopeptide (TPR) repeat protein
MIEQFFVSHPLTKQRIDYSQDQLDEITKQVNRPADNQLNRFDTIVSDTWKPRKPAYSELETGRNRLRNGEVKEAIKAFRKAKSIYVSDPLIHAWLGGALTEAYRFQEGREVLDQGLKLKKNIFRLRLFSGINYFELEKYQKSLQSLRAAQDLLPGMPEVIFYKGRNYDKLGVRRQAVDFYIRYLKMAPKGENTDYARRRLRQWGY